MKGNTVPEFEEYKANIREACKNIYLPLASYEDIDKLIEQERGYIEDQYDLYKSLTEKYPNDDYDDLKEDAVAEALSLIFQGIELDSDITWPGFDNLSKDEKEKYFEEHPFKYATLEEYISAMRKWIHWKYRRETEKSIDHMIEMNMIFVKQYFKEKTPIDLAAVDIMYCCG